MRTRDEVSDDKLRGGFYSPDLLVNLCIERVGALLGERRRLRMLEPSAGDGAFIRGLSRSRLAQQLEHVEAVELLGSEANKAARALAESGLPGRVVNENVLRWSDGARDDFDLLLANPPYVRFQFISEEDKQRAKSISVALGVTGTSVSNLWIPVFLLSIAKLRDGGAFSIILPTEFLTGISASVVRNWLIANTTDVTIDLFKPGSFPSVLQEVLILSGRVMGGTRKHGSAITFHDHNGGTRTWSHTVKMGVGTWTHYLLTPEQNGAFETARSLAQVSRLGNIARFSVSTVTGANGYFCIDDARAEMYSLREWTIPLLPRSRHASGLTFAKDEHEELVAAGQPAWLVDFSASKPPPERYMRPQRFLQRGIDLGIDQRYKCRVRTPWYRVPVVQPGDLLLSKRSNRFPRVIANHAGVVTTDTIYRGNMLPGAPESADDFAAAFHNSLTMLSAEVEGRSFGGGVLELVPSEVNALMVAVAPGADEDLVRLDGISRTAHDPEALIEATDEMLSKRVAELTPELLHELRDARQTLMDRRLQRTQSNFYD